MNLIELKWELFEKSKYSKEGKTFEDFKEWLDLKKINNIKSYSALETICKNHIGKKMDKSILCPNCNGSGITSYEDFDEGLVGACFSINHQPGYSICPVCTGLGDVSNRVRNSLLF